MLLVFALTLFTSATLLFLVQPMVGKMITPLLGGTPAVWNTCMVFFQAMLLAGYAYAHATTSWLGPRKQAGLHLALLAIPFIVLPIAVNKDLAPSGEANPVLGVLVLLTVAVGLPFFVVSASAPLLQKWFASTDHPAANDPYFLYGASNLGSMLALVSYPWLVEPSLRLAQQSWVWTAGYGLLLLLTAACAILMWYTAPARTPASSEVASTAIMTAPAKDTAISPAPVKDTAISSTPVKTKKKRARDKPAANVPVLSPAQQPVTLRRRLRWIALAFVPSSLMLGATTFITTDIAAIPLLWVVPLALYLLSFILVFSREPGWLHKGMILLMPLMVLLLAFMMLSGMTPKMWQYVLYHPLVLFVVAMVCHGELARDRPAAAQLTEFYLWMSVGGVLGGMFNALLAPVIFNGLVEYQLALVLACVVMPRLSEQEGEGFGYKFDLAVTGCLIVGAFAALTVGIGHIRPDFKELKDWFEQAVSNGWEIEPWIPARLTNLESQMWTMQLLRAMALGLALLAPLGLFLSWNAKRRATWFDWVLPSGMGLLTVALLFVFYGQSWEFETVRDFIRNVSQDRLDFSATYVSKFLVYGLPALLCYLFVERPLRFGLAFGAFLLASTLY